MILSSAYLPLIGGSELAIKNITDRLPDFDFDLITARFDKKNPKNEKIGNVNVYRVGFGSKLDKFLLPVLGLIKAKEIKRKGMILHGYQASYGAGAAWLIKLFNPNIPFIITIQEGKELGRQNFMIRFFRGMILKKADYATAISQYLRNYILQIKPDLKTDLIPNGVDIDNFSHQYSYGELTDLENKLGIMPDDKVIISVSRLVYKNGIDLLIKSLAIVKKKNTGVSYKLLLAGDGGLEKDLKKLTAELGLEDDVIYAGTVEPKDLPLYLKISDVFVRPSRSEGLGTAFLEAMAAGLPAIGPRVGGIPDFLEDRKTGLICKLEPEDIASRINVIFENEKLRQDIIENSQRLVKENYSWDIVADKFRELYKKLS